MGWLEALSWFVLIVVISAIVAIAALGGDPWDEGV